MAVYRDTDGDSWGDPTNTLRGCGPSVGWLLDNSDCDDGNSRVSPGATEQCNGIDDDCDGLLDSADNDLPATLTLYRDIDADGFGDPDDTSLGCVDGSGYAIDSEDCALLDRTVYPGAPEICGDGQINACEREPHEAIMLCASDPVDMAATSPTMEGDTTSGYLGSSLATLGDVDGDGFPDYAVGAPYSGDPANGEVFVMSGASLEDTDPSDALATLHHLGSSGGFGSSLAGLGDINLDGSVDILVGGGLTDVLFFNGGGVWAFLGPLDQDQDDSEAVLIVLGNEPRYQVGSSVSGGGDIEGDGIPDILIGAPRFGDPNQGAVAIVASNSMGTRLFNESSTLLLGEESSLAGTSVADLGDIDGDGLSNVLVGAPESPYDGMLSGAALLYLGGFSGTLSAASADAVLGGEAPDDSAGACVAALGDIDGDGLADFAIGAPFQSELALDAGAVYIGLGPRSGLFELDELDAVLLANNSYSEAGTSIAAVGDLDLDDQDDILIGAPESGYGCAWLLPGSLRGSVDISSEGRCFSGDYDRAGSSVSALGDITGDALQAALVGAPYNDGIGTNSGVVYLIAAFSLY